MSYYGKSKETPADPDFQLRVEIEEDVYNKIMHWINKCDYEVSGLGKVIYDEEERCFRVIDAILIKQENTTGTTEMDGQAIANAMFELKDTPGTLNWWWHSHVKMGVFWSGTDLDAIQKLGEGGWFLSTVFNQHEEMLSCFYQTKPFTVFADQLDTTILRYQDEDLVKEWDKEFQEKVTIKTWGQGNYGRYGSYGGGGYGGYSGYSGYQGGYYSGHGQTHGHHGQGTHLPSRTQQESIGGKGSSYLPVKYRLGQISEDEQDLSERYGVLPNNFDDDDDDWSEQAQKVDEWESELDEFSEQFEGVEVDTEFETDEEEEEVIPQSKAKTKTKKRAS